MPFRIGSRRNTSETPVIPAVPSTFICPTCIEEISQKDILIVRDGVEPNVPLSEFPRLETADERRRFDAQRPRREHQRVANPPGDVPPAPCPLPRGFGDRPSYIVGLIGVDSTSKSHLIHAIVKSLVAQRLRHFGYSVQLDRESRRDYELWYGAADQFKPVLLTPVEESRTITLVVEYRDSATNLSRSINLILVETAGENFLADIDDIAQSAPYVYAADAYLYLIPPDSIDSMPVVDEHGKAVTGDAGYVVDRGGDVTVERKARQSDEPVPSAESMRMAWRRRGSKTVAVLGPLQDIISDRRHDRGGTLRSPLFGVILTKVDLLEKHLPETAQSANFATLWKNVDYKTSPEDLTRRIEEDGQLVRSFLEEHDLDQIVANVNNMGLETEFFSLAAIGEPRNDNGMFPTAKPRRVLDPIVWILSNLATAEVL